MFDWRNIHKFIQTFNDITLWAFQILFYIRKSWTFNTQINVTTIWCVFFPVITIGMINFIFSLPLTNLENIFSIFIIYLWICLIVNTTICLGRIIETITNTLLLLLFIHLAFKTCHPWYIDEIVIWVSSWFQVLDAFQIHQLFIIIWSFCVHHLFFVNVEKFIRMWLYLMNFINSMLEIERRLKLIFWLCVRENQFG